MGIIVIVYMPGLFSPIMKAAVRFPAAPIAQEGNTAVRLNVGFAARENMHESGPVNPVPVTLTSV